jgi:hypothetical protein
MNNNTVTEIPIATMAQPTTYPTIENMTTTDKNTNALPDHCNGKLNCILW